MRRRATWLAVLTTIALAALVVGRAAMEARDELARADSHRREGETVRAVEHYRRALRWSFPMSPYTSRAVSELSSLARASEAAGDPTGALLAWRSLLGGLSATRSWYRGSSAAADVARDEIARLMVHGEDATVGDARRESELRNHYRRLLDRRVTVQPVWGTLALLGFAVWVGSLLLVTRRGFDPAGRPSWAAARGPLWGALAGFLSFVLGLFFA